MLVGEAKAIARRWVMEEGVKYPGFFGAYFAGSINWMADNEPLRPTSDVDVKLIIENLTKRQYRKSLYNNLLLEVSLTEADMFQSADTVLSNYYTAKHFTTSAIIADPSGKLAAIKSVVTREFPKRHWVRKRCEDARDWLLTSLDWLKPTEPFHSQVFSWVYPIGVAAQIMLVADLQNPTVRRMLALSGEVLARYGHQSLHETMLGLLGSTSHTREQVETLLTSCTEAFDIAKQNLKTPFFGDTMVTEYSRPVAIDGSREMIESGFHREAVLWICWTHTFCQTALVNDATAEVQEQFTPGYKRLLTSLGINSLADLRRRNERLKELLPRIWEAAESIMRANHAIVD